MKKVKILILECERTRELAGVLSNLLETSAEEQFQIKRERLASQMLSKTIRRISSLLASFSPSAAFLCLASCSRPANADLIRTFHGSGVALIAVIDAKEPMEIVEVLDEGASDFLIPPLRLVEVLARLHRLLEYTGSQDETAQRLKERLGLMRFIGESPALIAAIQIIPKVALCDVHVLLCGETGTGKEICARAIHDASPRANQPFIAINCGAIPVELIENELFGHESGAYTSANTSAVGLIRQADGGTVFLDEIDALSLSAQVKLLRFLQDKEVRPLGSNERFKPDVRVICATNADMEEIVGTRRFRADLYFRLNVVSLHLPPLRQRGQDVVLLAHHFLTKYTAEMEKPVKGLTPAALQVLIQHDWPGNVRELENVIERAVVLTEHAEIQADEIVLPKSPTAIHEGSFRDRKSEVVAAFERKYINGLLIEHHGNVSQAAHAARKNRRAFWQLMNKYHISRLSG